MVLASLESQSHDDFEVIIADDGSSSENVSKLKQLVNSSSLAIHHIWQEDKGFRKTKILNRAVSKTNSDYLIFIDTDCLLHKEFIKEHVENNS